MKTKKKFNLKYLIFSFILSILLLSTLCIIKFGQHDNTIKINMDEKTGKTYEIVSINIGGLEQNLKNFVNENILYDETYNFLYAKEPTKDFILKINALENIKITFIKNKDNGLVNIIQENSYKKTEDKIDTKSEIIENIDFIDGITIKEILLNEIRNFGFKEITISIILFIIFNIGFYYMIFYIINKIKVLKERNLKVIELLNILLFTFIIVFSHIYILVEIFNYIYGLIICILITIFIFKNKDLLKRIENIFLIFSIVLGMNFIFILPPFNVPDECSHYIKAYRMTLNEKEEELIKNKNTYDAILNIPANMYNFINTYTMNVHSYDYKISSKSLLSNYNTKINTKDTEYIEYWFGNTEVLNDFTYIPSAIAIKVSKLFNTSILFSLLLARLFNFIIFIILLYYAIESTSMFKKSLLITALLPITIQQAAAVNQDSITNTIALTLIALIISKIFAKDKSLDVKKFIIITMLGICLAYCKLVYFPLLLLLLLIPKDKFKNNKLKYKIIIPIITLGFLLSIKNIININMSGSSSGEFYTIGMMIGQPINTIMIFIRTFLSRGILDFLTGLVNGFGYFTKWSKIELLTFTIQIIYFLMYITANNKEAQKNINKKTIRISCFLIAGLIMGFIYCSLLTGWTKPNATVIDGLQSRYFIPIIPLLLILISNNIIKINIKNENLIYVILFIISTLITTFTLIEGFYI